MWWLAAQVRRTPFTVALCLVMVLLAVVTRTLWDPLVNQPLRDYVAYGVPALQAGRWWTVLFGAPFALHPMQYLPILLGLLLLGGFAEWRLGTRLAALLVIGCHLVAVGATVAFLGAASNHGWDWATGLSYLTDTGLSAGFLGAAAAATATLAPVWRTRARVALLGYVLVSVLYVGSMADVEHTFAVVVGLVLGPPVLGRRPRLQLHGLTRRGYRGLAAGFLVLSAIGALFDWLAPVSGPLTRTLARGITMESTGVGRGVPVAVALQIVVFSLLARGVFRGRRRAWVWAVGTTVGVLLILVVRAIGLGLEHRPGWPALSYQVALNLAGLWVLTAGRHAFRTVSPRRARTGSQRSLATVPDRSQQDAARRILQHQGTVNRLGWMTTWSENRWFMPTPDAGYLAYRVHTGVALGLCDPVAGRREDRAGLLAAFADEAQREGLIPCLFSATAEAAQHAQDLGWHAVRVAQEAVIDLPTMQFRGRQWQDVRTAINQATRHEVTCILGRLADQPRAIREQVREISAHWVEDKGLPELGFTLGGVEEALDPNVRMGIGVDASGRVHAVTSWMPVHADGAIVGWTLDVMRRRPSAFRYSMEHVISSACLEFRSEGCRWVSLSATPLAEAPGAGDSADREPLDGFLVRLGRGLEPYYGFRSLAAFKAKFQPRFEPLYLVFPDEAALPRIGMALSRAYLPEASLRELARLAISARPGGGSRDAQAHLRRGVLTRH